MLGTVGGPVADPGSAAGFVGFDTRSRAHGPDFTATGCQRLGNHRGHRRRLGRDFTAEAPAESAVHAGRSTVVDLGEDGDRGGVGLVAKLFARPFEQHARGLYRHRRAWVAPGAGWVGRPLNTRDADFPIDLGVIGLEVLIGNGPVVETGAGNGAEQASLLEIDFAETPVVGGEMNAAAAHVM